MDLQTKLLALPKDQWLVDLVVILDWYDGPRKGLCVLSRPSAELIFDLVEEKHNPDGLDVRFFRLRELPAGSVAQYVASTGLAASVTRPLWTPRYPNAEARNRAENVLRSLEAQAVPTGLIVATPDWVQFTGCERAEPVEGLRKSSA